MMALIAAEYNGVNINVPEFAMGTENKTPEFLAMNPNGKVPTLKTPQGTHHRVLSIPRPHLRVHRHRPLRRPPPRRHRAHGRLLLRAGPR